MSMNYLSFIIKPLLSFILKLVMSFKSEFNTVKSCHRQLKDYQLDVDNIVYSSYKIWCQLVILNAFPLYFKIRTESYVIPRDFEVNLINKAMETSILQNDLETRVQMIALLRHLENYSTYKNDLSQHDVFRNSTHPAQLAYSLLNEACYVSFYINQLAGEWRNFKKLKHTYPMLQATMDKHNLPIDTSIIAKHFIEGKLDTILESF